MKVMELSAGPGQRNKGTDARVGYLYKLPPSGDLSAMIDYKYNTMSLLRAMIVCKYDSISDVGEIRVYQRADFQSGSRVLKKVF